jgi:hypothetical protein
MGLGLARDRPDDQSRAMTDPMDVDALVAEVANNNFKDARLTSRLGKLLRGVSADPQASFPKVLGAAELEAAYRLFGNVLVTPEDILRPHFEATKARVEEQGCVRIVHDTTEFAYRRDGKRRGFDEDRAYQSFCGHFSLALSADRSRKPLGLAGLHTWPKGLNTEPTQSFWFKQIRTSELTLDCATKAIHIGDRGADDYPLLCELVTSGRRFVLRSHVDRITLSGPDGAKEKMRSVLARMEHLEERSAWINRRRRESSSHRAKIHPEREPRTIHLHISAARIEITRPPKYNTPKMAHLAHLPETLAINVVRVWEPEPPEGTTPVEWYLFTSEPISTPADLEAVVDHYRARWVIEEYFKAVKTGCAFEQRQLQDYESLINALALFAPLAYQILLLRTVARDQPDAPSSAVVSTDQLEVLRALGRRKLPEHPTARDVMLAVAALGGHIKYAPDPGWLTIARGFEKLETLTEGWVGAKMQRHSDQR